MAATHRMMSPDEYLKAVERTHPEPLGKPKRRWPKRVALGLLIFLLLVIVGSAGYLYWFMTRISNNPFDFSGLAADAGGRTNILILGIGDPGHAGTDLSDTMMLLSLEPAQKSYAMIGLPRDMRVDIPGYYAAKINAADALGGPQLAEQTVSNTLDLPINYYMKMDFTGFKDIVDAVGGVDITVTQELSDPEYPCANNQYAVCGLDIKPGNYHMNGAMALEYVRCRKGTCGNDFGRAQRQQAVMAQVIKKVSDPWIILRPWVAFKLAAAFRDNVQTNMGMNQLISLIWDYKHATTKIQFVFNNGPGGFLTDAYGSSDLLPVGGDYSAIQRFVNDIFTNPPKTPTQAQ